MSQGTESVPGGAGSLAEPAADRADLYRYVTADNAADYVALMRLFTDTLLADMSAGEAAALLAESGLALEVDDVEQRCRQLESWGNLVRSVRDARVATVAEWLRSRSRYQVSKLGGRVHRQVDDVLHASEGAREVARELLAGSVDTLDRILALLADPGRMDAEALAADVTTVFNNQRLFTESAADFYAYLNAVLSRYDLAGPEYAAFKTLLLEYVDLISADVSRHAPAVAERLVAILSRRDVLLSALATLSTLTGPDGTPAEQSPGRAEADWDGLVAWYTGRGGRSGPDQLRAAAEQALGQLIANAKRMVTAAGSGFSRRSDLLRLALWLSEAEPESAHRLYAAAFGAYPARHLLVGPEEADPGASAFTSWWDADPVDVPVALRERGDRAARGRTAKVPDPGLDLERLLAAAAEKETRRTTAAAELAAAGALHGATLTPAARDLLLDRLGPLLAAAGPLIASATATHIDTGMGLTLTATPTPGVATVVHSTDGQLTVHELTLAAAPWVLSVGERTGTHP